MKELTPEQIQLIKKPLPREAVKDHPTKKGMSTIKAIYVTERLNDVFGIGGWQIKTDLLPVDASGSLFSIRTFTTSQSKERTEYFAVSKTIFTVPEYGIHYECIAGAANDDMGDASKGSVTDAITKICSYIGIGIDVFKGMQEQASKQHEQTEQQEAQLALDVEATKAANRVAECATVADLTKLKSELPDAVTTHKKFTDAGKKRYAELTTPKTTAA